MFCLQNLSPIVHHESKVTEMGLQVTYGSILRSTVVQDKRCH